MTGKSTRDADRDTGEGRDAGGRAATERSAPPVPESPRVIGAAEVRRLLPMADCIDAMEDAMRAVSEGKADIPARSIVPLSGTPGSLYLMPGAIVDYPVYGVKVVGLHPGNPARGLPAVQGAVLLFDAETGAIAAVIDGGAITALRTAAASALATRLLAREDARTLGVLGCGVQAETHIEAMLAVRKIETIRVWCRSAEKAAVFAASQAARWRLAVAAVEPERAAASDIVCTVTGASEPIVHGAWARPGSHFNLIGAHRPDAREADSELVARGRLYVEQRAAALAEAGDILMPIDEGIVDESHIAGEIGELLLGHARGRSSAQDVTVYKSVGIFVQDLAAAHRVYMRGLGG